MARAYLICGYIGVGKTTLAKRLASSENAIRFTQDEWMSSIYGNYPDEATFTEKYNQLNQLINTVWPQCVAHGVNVVLDLNFWTRAERDAARARIHDAKGEAILYFVDCPLPTAWARIAKRNLALENGIYVSQQIFDNYVAKLQPLQADEDHIKVNG